MLMALLKVLAGNVEAQASLPQTQETRHSMMKTVAMSDPRRHHVKQNDKNDLDGAKLSRSQIMIMLSLE